MRIPVPDRLREHARPDRRTGSAASMRATIVLLRDGDDGLEVYLLRRQTTMDFLPGMYVFPGGKAQASDRDVDAWVGPSADDWGKRFGCDADTARGLVVAAVRETFEESGILLAGPGCRHRRQRHERPGHAGGAGRARERGVRLRRVPDRRGLLLRADLVGAWSHWITPAFEPRRYDTRFFVAALPEGQVVGELPGEADRAHWAPLTRVLEKVDAGEAMMLPPTAITCREVSQFSAAAHPHGISRA